MAISGCHHSPLAAAVRPRQLQHVLTPLAAGHHEEDGLVQLAVPVEALTERPCLPAMLGPSDRSRTRDASTMPAASTTIGHISSVARD